MKLLRELLFPLIAVVAAFFIGGILILIIGDDPIVAYKLLLGSALSWPDGIGYTLFYATPLIFTGLAVLVAEPKELTIVSIVGTIDPEDVRALGGHFAAIVISGDRASPFGTPKAPKRPFGR